MEFLSIGHRLIAAVVVCLCMGCVDPIAIDTLQPSSVIVVVPIDRRLFAGDATLVAQIWNSQQLAALENNAKCIASRDSATGGTEMRCPPGITYQEVVPQKVERSVATAGERLEIPLQAVRAGERFRIRVSGRSADGCNTTSGEQTSAAQGGTTIVGLVWETTAKAC